MASLVMGVVLMSHRRDRLTGLAWHLIGLASGLGLYFLNSYSAFFEGSVLAFYTASLWPHLAKRVTSYPPGKVATIALVTWCLLCVTSVWVVAYNFVPGGTVTRERTDVLMALVIFLVAVASRDYSSKTEGAGEKSTSDGREEGGNGKIAADGGERMQGLRRRHMSRLPPISEEEEEEEEEEVDDDEKDGELRDLEVDSTGSSVHEERALELLVAEEKECIKFRHRANKGVWVWVPVCTLSSIQISLAFVFHSCASYSGVCSPRICLSLPPNLTYSPDGNISTHLTKLQNPYN